MSTDPFTHLVIDQAMETHRSLGPGLAEELYHRDLVARLVAGGVGYESKLRRELVYRGQVADAFEPDIVFPRQLIVELKSLRTEFLPDHFTQLLAYQKFWAICTGLLFDFGKASLIFKRVVFTSVVAEFPVVLVPAWAEPSGLATALVELLGQVQRDHGLGYRETTWRGLVVAALKADGVGHLLAPAVAVGRLGVANLRCIVIQSRCALMIGALGEGVSATDRAYLQTYLRWLGLPWGIAVHFGRKAVDVRFVMAPTNRDCPQIQGTTDG